MDRPAQRRDQLFVARQENLARPVAPDKIERNRLVATGAVFLAAAGAVEAVVDFRLQRLRRPGLVEAYVEKRGRLRRDDVGGRIADIDRNDLEVGRLEIPGAGVEDGIEQRVAQSVISPRTGLSARCGIGDVTLPALDW